LGDAGLRYQALGEMTESPKLARRGIHEIRIEVGDQVVLVNERSDEFIAQTEIEGEL